MSLDLSQKYLLLEQFRNRYREQLASVRGEFVVWLKNFFKKRKPTKRAEQLYCFTEACETENPRWCFCWVPGSQNNTWNFQSSNPIPHFITESEATELGLLPTEFLTLRWTALWDLALDAWGEAGGFEYTLPLKFQSWVFRKLEDPRPWVAHIQEEIQKESTGNRRTGNPVQVSTPISGKLPTVAAPILTAVMNGEPKAIENWADAVEKAGDPESAELLHWLVTFREHIAEEVLAVAPEEGFYINEFQGSAAWVIGDCDCEVENHHTRNLSKMLAGWQDYHSALEWLFRSFKLPQVQVDTKEVASGQNAERYVYNLAAGEHFKTVKPTLGVTNLAANPVAN